MKIFLVGYPGDIGGACTEAWHTIRLWREAGAEVHLIPTWLAEEPWRAKCDALGCVTHETGPEGLERIPDLAGGIVVSFCNGEFLKHAAKFKALGCRLVWANCMTWLFDAEKSFYRSHGCFDAYMFQSEFMRDQLAPQLEKFGYRPEQGHLIRGAFDADAWEFRPRPHSPTEDFFVGRLARPDADKWSSNTWKIYGQIQFAKKRALMLGMNDATHRKLGKPPAWADCLSPRAISAQDFMRQLHCLLPINGGARENWPRAGLEAFACGVPVVAQNQWGWRDMIEHGETGFLGSTDEELAHWAATLAYDEPLRLRVAEAAREKLVSELASPERLWEGWEGLFQSLEADEMAAA